MQRGSSVLSFDLVFCVIRSIRGFHFVFPRSHAPRGNALADAPRPFGRRAAGVTFPRGADPPTHYVGTPGCPERVRGYSTYKNAFPASNIWQKSIQTCSAAS